MGVEFMNLPEQYCAMHAQSTFRYLVNPRFSLGLVLVGLVRLVGLIGFVVFVSKL